MGNEDRRDLLAGYAMWARDYARAVEFYEGFLQSRAHLDSLMAYRTYFDLTIANTILAKSESAQLYREKLESYIERMRTRYIVRENRKVSIARIRSRIMQETNPIKMRKLLEEHFPDREDMLPFFISSGYAKRFLSTVIGNAKRSKPIEVFTKGIFRYTLDSELYRVIARAYSAKELELEKLSELGAIKILIKNINVYYVESELLRIISSVQREGVVLCQYFLQNSRDTSGCDQINEFLGNISRAFEQKNSMSIDQ